MPTARQLETYLAVIDYGSIRSAADHLGISQPSVSKQILALERKVGAILLDRHRGSKAIPTQAGTDLVAVAREAVELQKRLQPQVAARDFPDAVVVMMRQHLYTEITPWIEEQQLPGRATEIRFQIVNDEVDPVTLPNLYPDRVVLVRSPDAQTPPGICARLLAREKCSLYASPAIAGSYGATPHTMPVLVPSSGLLMQWQKDHLRLAGIADAQLVPSPAFMSVLLRQALAGRGAAVFMDSHVSGHVSRGELVPLLDDIAALYLQFLWHRSLDPVLADELCSAVTALRSAPAQNHR